MGILRPTAPIRLAPNIMLAARVCLHITIGLWATIVFYEALFGSLPGDPVQYLLDFSGTGALNLLMLSLSISLVSQHLKFAQLMKFRKTLGVYAAVYALLHFSVFIAFELQFEWNLLLSEIIERPYITVGFSALLILVVLLTTSFEKLKRRMGPLWQQIHNGVYLALILGNIHYIWSVKSLELLPIIYIALTLILFLFKRNKIIKIFK